MICAWRENYVFDVPTGHKFPMEKYELLYRQLNHEGVLEKHHFIRPEPIDIDFVKTVHDPLYVDRLLNIELTPREQRVTGFIHNPELIERELCIMEGTRRVAQEALKLGIGFNIAGGTHHAFKDRGEGFCLLNDQVLAAHWLLDHTTVSQILILDLDVHQGNGTASMCADDKRILTLSIHGKNNYPLKKETSDWDIELNDGTEGKTYLRILQESLTKLPNTIDFLFYQSGVDVLKQDKLGKLNLTVQECMERDRLVYQYAYENNIPVVATMGGGYGQHIAEIVNAHCNTFKIATQLF